MDVPRTLLLSMSRLALRLSAYLEALAFLRNEGNEPSHALSARGRNAMPQPSSRSFFAALWRRVPITIVTVGILVAGWAYGHFSVSPIPTSSANADAQVIPPIVSRPVPATVPWATPTVRPHAPLAAFRRLPVGPNEVDYIAEDVTMRIFTPRTTSHAVRRRNKQVEIGDDVTVRYFPDKARLAQSVASSASMSK